jgi:hypothetical protein
MKKLSWILKIYTHTLNTNLDVNPNHNTKYNLDINKSDDYHAEKG